MRRIVPSNCSITSSIFPLSTDFLYYIYLNRTLQLLYLSYWKRKASPKIGCHNNRCCMADSSC